MNALSTATAHQQRWATRARQVWQRLRQSGWHRSLNRWSHRGLWTAAEWWLGLDTAGSIPARELGLAEANFGYQPVDCQSCLLALRRAGVSRQDVFVDIGCGKGRAVLLAALFPFRRVIGVERSAVLSEVARHNVRRAEHWLRCRQVEIVCDDATQFELPPDASVLFFYNPFSCEVMQQVLQRIQQSLQQHPRRMTIIYALPKMDRDVLSETPWLNTLQSLQSASCNWQRLTIYAFDPHAASQQIADPPTAAEVTPAACDNIVAGR